MKVINAKGEMEELEETLDGSRGIVHIDICSRSLEQNIKDISNVRPPFAACRNRSSFRRLRDVIQGSVTADGADIIRFGRSFGIHTIDRVGAFIPLHNARNQKSNLTGKQHSGI